MTRALPFSIATTFPMLLRLGPKRSHRTEPGTQPEPLVYRDWRRFNRSNEAARRLRQHGRTQGRG